MVKLKRRKDESSLIAAFRRIRISSMPPTKLLLETKILLYDDSRKSFYVKYFMENYKKFIFKKCISLHSTNEKKNSLATEVKLLILSFDQNRFANRGEE